jgi:hypothetical protein
MYLRDNFFVLVSSCWLEFRCDRVPVIILDCEAETLGRSKRKSLGFWCFCGTAAYAELPSKGREVICHAVFVSEPNLLLREMH